MTPISLIITILNEESSLPILLDSLEKQVLQPAELVVVDGGSTDGSVELVRRWSSTRRLPVTILVRPGVNISAGRNIAIAAATNDLIAITDAGTELDPEWLSSLYSTWDADTDVVSGFYNARGESPIQQAIAYTIVPLLSEIDPTEFLPSSRSLLVTRNAWAQVGGYPEWLDYCEDLVLDLNLKKLGMRFRFAPSAVAHWDARPSLGSYMRQYYRYARGDGKASLWPKRHAARYGAYLFAIMCVVRDDRSRTLPWVLAGYALYTRKFFLRVRARGGGHRELALIPVIVTLGDVAKMVGYPVGRIWRAQNRVSIQRT